MDFDDFRDKLVDDLRELDDDEMTLLDFTGYKEKIESSNYSIAGFMAEVTSKFQLEVDNILHDEDGTLSLTTIFADVIEERELEPPVATFFLLIIHRTPLSMKEFVIQIFDSMVEEDRNDIVQYYLSDDFKFSEIPISVRIFMLGAPEYFDEEIQRKIQHKYDNSDYKRSGHLNDVDFTNDQDDDFDTDFNSSDDDFDDLPDFRFN